MRVVRSGWEGGAAMSIAVAESGRVIEELAGTRRFTVEEYHRLIDADILGPGDPVELLDGYVLLKPDHVAPPSAGGPFPRWRWLRRWSLAEYHRMVELGVLTPEDKVELLDGYLALKMPQNTPHRSSVVRLSTRLPKWLPDGWFVMTQVPVVVGGVEPEPDGAVVRGTDADYDKRDVVAADLGVIIEVSDSSLSYDRGYKRELYARAGLPFYWIVNVEDKQVEVYADPDPAASPPAYRTRNDYRPGEDVPVVLDGVAVGTIPVAELIA